MNELFTVGQIADRLEEPTARVAYMISKMRIKPISRVGIIRQFNEEQIQNIKQGLYGIRIQK